ncbi:MAG: tetratricopeptide repeat protein [candidate division Zixibacteria bacterium]|nr:tetratricopeptide repeat protein [candidate division Zixibacteria bacterium]
MRLWILILGVCVSMNSANAEQKPDFDTLWNYYKPAETEVKFRELLPAARKSGDAGFLVELTTQIARTLGLQQKFAEAHALLDSTLPLLDAAGERARVRYLLERGRTFNSSKQQEKSVPLFTEAWERAQKAGYDFYAVDAAHMLAIATPAAEHMGWNMNAVAVAKNSRDPKARNWLGSLYNNIGWDYFDQKKFESAREMFEKALSARVEQKKPAEIRFAKWCIAKTLRMLGKADSALAVQRQLEKEWRDSGEEQDGYVFEELGECLLALNRRQESEAYFARAYEFLSKDPWLTRDEPDRLMRLKELGKVKSD